MKWISGARRALFVSAALAAGAMTTGWTYQSLAQSAPDTEAVVAGEFIVKYRSSAFFADMESPDLRFMEQYETGRLLKIQLRRSQQLNELLKLYSNPNVEYVVPNIRLHTYLKSSELTATALKSQWHIAKVQAEKAWTRAGNRGRKNVIVAVIDTGVDYQHKSLSPNMVSGYDFRDFDNDPMDKTGYYNDGHGTHCAGVIAATGQFDGGTIGVSPEVSVMPLRLLDHNGGGDILDGAKAIDFAIKNGAGVISASWGARISRAYATPLIEAINRAGAAGIPFVVASANDGRDNDRTEYYPTNAGTDNTIAVAATDATDARPYWSNFGKTKVHISAPGDEIMSTIPGDRYMAMSGTSMAAPLVAGVVALLRSQDFTLTPLEIRSLLQASGDKIGIEVACNCRINAFSAVDMLLSRQMFVSPYSAGVPQGESRTFTAVFGQPPFRFTSSNPAVGSIDSSGVLKGIAEGETVVSVTDATGNTASSFKIYIGKALSSSPRNGGGQATDSPVQCPVDDEETCEMICQIYPELPYCF